MYPPEVTAAIIISVVTVVGVIMTVLYNFFHERAEDRRHDQQLQLEERRSKFAERQLTIELYNQRQVLLFEERLKHYPDLYAVLGRLAGSDLPLLTPDTAVDIEAELKVVAYGSASACLSTESLQALKHLRDTLQLLTKDEARREDVGERRIVLFRALHKDLARTGEYLGTNEPLFIDDRRAHEVLRT